MDVAPGPETVALTEAMAFALAARTRELAEESVSSISAYVSMLEQLQVPVVMKTHHDNHIAHMRRVYLHVKALTLPLRYSTHESFKRFLLDQQYPKPLDKDAPTKLPSQDMGSGSRSPR